MSTIEDRLNSRKEMTENWATGDEPYFPEVLESAQDPRRLVVAGVAVYWYRNIKRNRRKHNS